MTQFSTSVTQISTSVTQISTSVTRHGACSVPSLRLGTVGAATGQAWARGRRRRGRRRRRVRDAASGVGSYGVAWDEVSSCDVSVEAREPLQVDETAVATFDAALCDLGIAGSLVPADCD